MSTKQMFKTWADVERRDKSRTMGGPRREKSPGHKRAKEKRDARRAEMRAAGTLKKKTEKPDLGAVVYDQRLAPKDGTRRVRKDGSPRKRPKKNSSDAGQPIPGSRA